MSGTPNGAPTVSGTVRAVRAGTVRAGHRKSRGGVSGPLANGVWHRKSRFTNGVWHRLNRAGIRQRCLAPLEPGLVDSVAEVFPEARWQRCIVHFYRNVFSIAVFA